MGGEGGGERGDQGGPGGDQSLPGTLHTPVQAEPPACQQLVLFKEGFLFFMCFPKVKKLHKNFSLEHQISNLPVVEIYLKRQTKKWPEYPKLRMSWNPL